MVKTADGTQPIPNPAQTVLGAIPSGGQTDFYTGLPSGYAPPSGRKPKDIYGANGKVVGQTYYSPTLDANVILQQTDPKKMRYILDGLAARGAYGASGKVDGILTDKSRAAFGDLLIFANVSGLPWDQAYQEYIKQVPPGQTGGKAPSIRVTNREEVLLAVKKAAQDLLGVELSPEDEAPIAEAFRRREIRQGQLASSGGVYEDAPSAAVFAEQQIRKTRGAEVQVQSMANFADIMDNVIKGLA
jgi:hypothetical protein